MHPQEPAPGQPAARPVVEASTPGAGAELSVAPDVTAETENAIPPRDPSHASGATEAVPLLHQSITLSYTPEWHRRPWRAVHVVGTCITTQCWPTEEALLTAVAGMLPRLAEQRTAEETP